MPDIFPPVIAIEDMPVCGFQDASGLFRRIAHEVRRPKQSLIAYLNVHVANTAQGDPRLKAFLQEADCLYCDGAGIQAAAAMLGGNLPCRLPAADWFLDLFDFLAGENITVYLLGGEPGIVDKMKALVDDRTPRNTIVGTHHGYIMKDTDLENRVIADINAKKPDLLILGFGTPIQEHWIDRNRHRLEVSTLWPLGAVMDYFTGKLRRCPDWMGNNGLEWLYRLYVEPRRLFSRYVIGNPWFFSRIITAAMLTAMTRQVRLLSRPASIAVSPYKNS